MKHFLLLLLCFLFFLFKSNSAVLSGTITDVRTGEALIGVSVGCVETMKGTSSNMYGFFSLTADLPCTVVFRYVGYEELRVTLKHGASVPLSIRMHEKTSELKEVVIHSAKKEAANSSNQTGVVMLDLKNISTIPTLGGEPDLVKVLQLMPGIKRGSEGSTGMLVRGGSADQNLILVDEAPVYNASHLLGFFSVFNSSAIKDVTMQKGGFSANYGGRLSSVMDVRMKEGNMKEFHLDGGIGILSARFTAEGPLVRDRISFILSGRRSYVDQAYKVVGKSMPFYFYDLNAKVNFRISEKDHIYISSYKGSDVLSLGGNNSIAPAKETDIDFGTALGNTTVTARWNHVYPSQKLFQNISLIHSRFQYSVDSRISNSRFKLESSIEDYMGKVAYDYYLSNRNHIRAGGELILHHFTPGNSFVQGEFNEAIRNEEGISMHTREVAAYLMNDQFLTAKWSVQYGVRLSGAAVSGRTYFTPEPRISISHHLTANQDLKLAYSRMTQYMHLVSGSSTAMPTDLWYPVSERIKPQSSKQITLGYTFRFAKDLELTAESYYKELENVVEYMEGTVGMLNNNIEADLLQGKGKAYGMEVMLHRKQGRFNGWLGYTLSWSTRQFDELNKGKEFFTRYDRRHDLSLVANYELTSGICLSGAWVFATGSRFTPVTGQYLVPNGNYTNVDALPIYAHRNSVVLASSHRLDLNLVLKSKPGKSWNSELSIGGYNIYNQTQPYRVKITTSADGNMRYKQVGLFGFIPSIGYNFKF